MKPLIVSLLLFGASPIGLAQFGPAGPPPAPKSAKDAASADLTGYWVSVVSEDYRWRMVTPPKGDAASVPYRVVARKVIDAWDPAKDETAGLQCKAYGAPDVMRIPGRLHITWQDENSLKIETSEGRQTRLFRFGRQSPASQKPSWQGFSTARWEAAPPAGGNVIPLGFTRLGSASKALEVHTTNLREGYLRKNGLPYSDRTTVDEYYDLFKEANGDTWFTVTTVVIDPEYLMVPFVTSTDFKKEADGTKFKPAPCTAR